LLELGPLVVVAGVLAPEPQAAASTGTNMAVTAKPIRTRLVLTLTPSVLPQ